MNWDLFFAVIFYGLILLFFFRNRKKFEIQGKILALYKTKIGLKPMNRISKFYPKFLKFIGIIGIVVGFLGMIFIFYWLVSGAIKLITVPEAAPALAPVLPGIRIPGAPPLSFWHWIIAIFVVAVVHEFSHGVFARLYKIKIKSSGFAFLGPILAAFVEPDEKTLTKKSKKAQLSVFSAGPFSNIILGFVFLLILNFLTGPFQAKIFEGDGIIINEIIEGTPAEEVGLTAPVIIKEINNEKVLNAEDFLDATSKIKPNQKIKLTTDKGIFTLTTIENPENKSKGFIGVKDFEIKTKIKKEIKEKFGEKLPRSISWINMLIFWLFIINVGIGLFNLLPLGPVDGGRIFYTLAFIFFKNEKKTKKIWTFISAICLILIIINLLPYLIKLLLFIIKPFLILFP